MNKRPNTSARSPALPITAAIALLSAAAISLASIFAPDGTATNPGTTTGPTPTPGCPNDTWNATNTSGAPTARGYHTAVWTGNEMIVWGGYNFNTVNTGGKYNPITNSWTSTSTINAPVGRGLHTAVWTGSEMIVWGGQDSNSNILNTGGRYNPVTNSWAPISTTNAPSAREFHLAVWTGTEMIVWGGFLNSSTPLNTGGKYNPITDTWTPTTTTNAPSPRVGFGVWTGSEMIVWGGQGSGLAVNTGGRYNPMTDSWTATTTVNAPARRGNHASVWTGSEMIIWAGSGDSGYINTGGRYNPLTDSWTATTNLNAPIGRTDHTAVWTGNEMIVWGGVNPPNFLKTGGRYNPNTDTWTSTNTAGAPNARDVHTAIWDGSEMIVWGGLEDDGIPTPSSAPAPITSAHPPDTITSLFAVSTGGKYCAQSTPAGTPTPTPSPTPTPTPTPTATLPPPTPTPTATIPPPTPTPTPTPTPVASPTPFFSTIIYENFDYTIPPALPPNWHTSFTAGPADCTPSGTCASGTNWVTTKSNPDSGPICVFHDAPACVIDSVLDTPSFHVPTCYRVVGGFRHDFNLESGHDGAVLEISINGGSFTDIEAAGGAVGYNGTISTGFQSPLAGRPAWTGNSGGYQGVGITLPPAASGQDVVLRFRLATDCSGAGGSGTGWSIDVLYLWYNNEAPPVAISGRVFNCNPAPGPTPPVSGVQMTLSGCAGGPLPPTTTSGTGDYSFQSLPNAGTYTVTPSKAARVPGSPGINTLDVIAVQRHFLNITPLTGCRLTAADVTPPAAVNTLDVIAIQHFFIAQTTGIGNTGKYLFNPVSRTYFSLMGNQTAQNYDTIILGDCAGPFVSPP